VKSPDAETIREEINDALTRLTEPEFVLSEKQKSELSKFIEETFRPHSGEDHRRRDTTKNLIPEPSVKSCFELSGQDGGCAIALFKKFRNLDPETRPRIIRDYKESLVSTIASWADWSILAALDERDIFYRTTESELNTLRLEQTLRSLSFQRNALRILPRYVQAPKICNDVVMNFFFSFLGLETGQEKIVNPRVKDHLMTIRRLENKSQEIQRRPLYQGNIQDLRRRRKAGRRLQIEFDLLEGDLVSRGLYQQYTVPATEMYFKEALKIVSTEVNARILPIVQPDGKIRIATIHSTVEAWVARAVSGVCFPHLKDISISRDMLRNERVRLFNPKKGSKLVYSADLSKSTDPIGVGTARFVLLELAKWIHVPEWFHGAVEGIIKTHRLRYDEPVAKNRVRMRIEPSRCGALMGQGPGWAVLTILNSFCAWKAGAPKGSYKTCGDDLTALWSQRVIDGYERNIASVGLKANTDKSFRHPERGVFCEQLMKRDGPHSAYGQPLLRIGEATGSRALAKGKGRVVTDHLTHVQTTRDCKVLPPVKNAARRAGLKGTISSSVPGRLAEGGGGRGKADKSTFRNYLQNGPIRLFLSESTSAMRALRAQLHDMPTHADSQESVDLEEILVEAKTRAERHSRELSLRQGNKPGYARLKTLKCQLRHGEHVPADYSPIAHLDEQSEKLRLNRNDKRRCKHYLRRRRYGAAIRVLRQVKRTVPLRDALDVMNTHFPPRSRASLSLLPVSDEAGFTPT
jgi:hypothetical protein